MISLLGINHGADIVGTAEIAQKHILCLWEVIHYTGFEDYENDGFSHIKINPESDLNPDT
jgi:hypothetical protein